MKNYASRLKSTFHEHQTFLLILAAFLGFRLLLAVGFGSMAPTSTTTCAGDRWPTADTIRLSITGPNIRRCFPWSAILLYRISTLVPALPEERAFWYASCLRLTMTLFDAGSVMLVYWHCAAT